MVEVGGGVKDVPGRQEEKKEFGESRLEAVSKGLVPVHDSCSESLFTAEFPGKTRCRALIAPQEPTLLGFVSGLVPAIRVRRGSMGKCLGNDLGGRGVTFRGVTGQA